MKLIPSVFHWSNQSERRTLGRQQRDCERYLFLALGMSSKALGARLGVTAQGVRKLEQAEEGGTITLNTLARIAHGLDCEVHYVFVPRTSLVQQVLQRIHEVSGSPMPPLSRISGTPSKPPSSAASPSIVRSALSTRAVASMVTAPLPAVAASPVTVVAAEPVASSRLAIPSPRRTGPRSSRSLALRN